MSNSHPPGAEDDAPLVEPEVPPVSPDLGSLDTERILRETEPALFPSPREEEELPSADPGSSLASDAPAVNEKENEDDAEPIRDGAAPSGINILAIISLVLALALSPFALVFGYLAVGQARRSHQKGESVAWVAVSLGWVWAIAYVILGVILGAAWLQVS